jgi:hypothetical protein
MENPTAAMVGASSERPSDRYAAERRYEFSPSNTDYHLNAPQWGHADWNDQSNTTPQYRGL